MGQWVNATITKMQLSIGFPSQLCRSCPVCLHKKLCRLSPKRARLAAAWFVCLYASGIILKRKLGQDRDRPMDQPGNSHWRGCVSTVDLRVKIVCFVKKQKKFHYKKQLICTSKYKGDANCTDSSPSVRIPWINKPEGLCFKTFYGRTFCSIIVS
jgi:hypothetical protein